MQHVATDKLFVSLLARLSWKSRLHVCALQSQVVDVNDVSDQSFSPCAFTVLLHTQWRYISFAGNNTTFKGPSAACIDVFVACRKRFYGGKDVSNTRWVLAAVVVRLSPERHGRKAGGGVFVSLHVSVQIICFSNYLRVFMCTGTWPPGYWISCRSHRPTPQ